MKQGYYGAFSSLWLFAAAAVSADPATIEAITATERDGTWRFDVTILHADTGWDDYADGWRVELEDGTVLGTRTLFHPHVEEQPFTRSLPNVPIPGNVDKVFLRARTNVDGWAETTTMHSVAR